MRALIVVLALGAGLASAGCTVTGTAAPQSAYAHSGSDLQYIGEPGYNAP